MRFCTCGQEEQKSRSFRDIGRRARSAPYREQQSPHEMTSPAGELGLDKQPPSCRLLHIILPTVVRLRAAGWLNDAARSHL